MPLIYDLIRPEWLEAWNGSLGQVSGFFSDIGKAQEIAKKKSNFATQAKATLCLSSFLSRGKHLSGELLCAAVEHEHVTPHYAKTLASFLENASEIAPTIAAIAKYFPDGQQRYVYQEALDAAISKGDALGLYSLLNEAPASFRVLISRQLLVEAGRYRPGWSCGLLARISMRTDVPADVRVDARKLAITFARSSIQKGGDLFLPLNLPDVIVAVGAEQVPDLFDAALQHTADVFASDADRFNRSWLDEREDRRGRKERRLVYPHHSVMFLVKLLNGSPDARRQEVLDEILRVLNNMQSAKEKIKGVVEIAGSHMMPESYKQQLLKECLELARTSEPRFSEAKAAATACALSNLAPIIPAGDKQQYLNEVLGGLRELEDKDYQKFFAVLTMAHAFPEDGEVISLLVRCAYAGRTSSDRGKYLTWSAPFVPQERRKGILRDAWAESLLIDDEWYAMPCMLTLSCLTAESLSDFDARFWPPLENAQEFGHWIPDVFTAIRLGSPLGQLVDSRFSKVAMQDGGFAAYYRFPAFRWAVFEKIEDLFRSIATAPSTNSQAELLLQSIGRRADYREAITGRLTELLPELTSETRIKVLGILWSSSVEIRAKAEEAFAAAKALALRTDESKEIVKRLTFLARCISEEHERRQLVDELLNVLREMEDSEDKDMARAQLLAVLDPGDQLRIMNELLVRLPDYYYNRNEIATAMCPFADPSGLATIVRLVRREYSRDKELVQAIVERWAQLRGATDLRETNMLGELIDGLSEFPRDKWLERMITLSPAVGWVGGRAFCKKSWRRYQIVVIGGPSFKGSQHLDVEETEICQFCRGMITFLLISDCARAGEIRCRSL